MKFKNLMLKITILNLFIDFLSTSTSLLSDFICSIVEDELKNHPELKTISIIELENYFPLNFSDEILKCLHDVALVLVKSKSDEFLDYLTNFSRSRLIIFIADRVKKVKTSRYLKINIEISDFIKIHFQNFQIPLTNHMSKIIFVANNKKILKVIKEYRKVLNLIVVYLKNDEINVKIPNFILNETFHLILENKIQENISNFLFSDKLTNLHKYPLNIVWTTVFDALQSDRKKLIDNNLFFVQILAEKMNATLNFIEIIKNQKPGENFFLAEEAELKEVDEFDLYLRTQPRYGDIKLYHHEEYCFIVLLPPKYSIVEMILILPFDKSVWMWLGVVAGLSTIIWRFYGIFEGSSSHWKFLFGIFAFFVGQSTEIKT